MQQKTGSRLDTNREVRRIFVRHGVDTSKIHFSCQGKSLQLSGILLKEGGTDIESNIVEAISQELTRLGVRIVCELENWSFMDGSISKKASKQPEKLNEKAAKAGDIKNALNSQSKP